MVVASPTREPDLALGHRLAQLAAMLRAGITPASAVEALARAEHHPYATKMLRGVVARLQQGSTLQHALSADERLLLARETLRDCGDQTPAALERLAAFYRTRGELRATARTATLYPRILLLGLVGLAALLVYLIVPQMERLFRELGTGSLPQSTQLLFSFSHSVREKTFELAIAGVVLTAVVLYLRRRHPELVGRVTALVPLVGDTLRRASLAEFLEALALRLAAKAPTETAYAEAAAAVGHLGFRAQLQRTAQRVQSTGRVSEGLGAAPGLVRPLESVLVTAAEERSPEALVDAARRTVRLLEARSRQAIRVLAPVTVVVMALLILGAAAALGTPMFDIAGSLRG